MNTNESHSPETAPPKPAFSEGQKLAGCYGLKRALSGAPAIWLAHDEVLGKDVSLHSIPAALLGDAAAMEALRQEVKRTRQLIHPQILRVYDLVEDAGWAAVSMDAFDGESLAARLAKKGAPLDPAELEAWLAPLCQTLEDAHKINVVHRDVSPANIFLNADGKCFVANFGLSRVIADAVARLSGQENPRLAALSPQQLEGAAATRLDDVYAVGALLFESLTGRLPFAGENLPAQIRDTAPPTVASQRGGGAAAASEAWEKTIAACLAKAPDARPQSGGEIARLLHSTGVESVAAPVPAAVVGKKIAVIETGPLATAANGAPPKSEPKFSPKKTAPAPPAGPAKPAPTAPKFAPDVYTHMAAKGSRAPALGLAIAAGLMVVGAAGYYFNGLNRTTTGGEATAGLTPTEQPEGSEWRSVNNKIDAPPAPAAPAPVLENSALEPEISVPEPDAKIAIAPAAPVAPAAPAAPAPVREEMFLAAVAPTAAAGAPPTAVPVAPISAAAMTDEEKAVAEKMAALERAKQAAQAGEKERADMAKQQQQADAAVAEAQKVLDQKNKSLAPVKKAVEEVLAQRKKLEDEQKAADLAAEQARQLAAEKARVAEAAKKAIADLELKNKDKLAAQEKVDAEMAALQKTLADKQQSAAALVKTAADAETARAQRLAAIKLSEQEVEQAKVAAVEARRMREEAEAERRKLGQELVEMQKMMEKKKAEIEERLRKLENPTAKPPAPPPESQARPVEKPAPPAPPAPAVKPTAAVATPAPATPAPMPATPAPVAVLPKPAPATPAPAEPKPAPPEPTQLAMKTEPPKGPVVSVPTVPKPPVAGGAENSLGMKFTPVGDVEFSVWQTRVKDFDVFARAVNLKSAGWRSPGFKQAPEHPVVNVTWVEAVAFCKWLTDLEHKDGGLPPGQFYRLPTDLEWSKAVGLPEETGKTPEARDMGVSDVYPWGTQWPPPPNAGNYTGEETGSDVAIKGYDDGFAWTAPVGSFPPNKLGIYDMGGNVWQWCMDAWNSDSKAKVLRGASWYNGALKLSLLSSCRVHASPDSSTDNYGFRIVRAADAGRSGKR